MDEMHFICDKQIVTIETMVRLGEKREDILKLGYDTGNNKSFKLDGYNYKVVLPHGNLKSVIENPEIPNKKPRAKRWEPVKEKQTGKNNRKLFISNIVRYDRKNNCSTDVYIDGVFITREDLAIKLNCSYATIHGVLNRIKSVTINGYNILIEIPTYLYTIKKDGVIYDNLTLRDCIKKTGLTRPMINNFEKTGCYSKKDGWQILNRRIERL